MTARAVLTLMLVLVVVVGIVAIVAAQTTPPRPAACSGPAAYTDAGLRACFDALDTEG